MMEILTVPDDPNGQNDRTDLDQENQFRTLSDKLANEIST